MWMIGSFLTQSGLDAAIKYEAYEVRHVINNYKPYTVDRFRGMSLGWLLHRDFLLDEVMKRWPDSN
jgi:hypothetical protein